MAESLRGAPKVLAAPEKDFRFTDSRRGFVSIINRASVAAIENMVGVPVDPLRFRGNVYVDGMAPWAEFDLIGQMLEADSGVRLKVTARIERCAATNVDPDDGLSRPRSSQHVAAPPRPRRLRRLRRGFEGRRGPCRRAFDRSGRGRIGLIEAVANGGVERLQRGGVPAATSATLT